MDVLKSYIKEVMDIYLVLKPGEVFVKSTSHRASDYVRSALGKSPQTYYSGAWFVAGKRVPAATSYFVVTDEEFEKIKNIRGVSKARFRVDDGWMKTISYDIPKY